MELAKSCPAGEAGTRTVRGRATRAQFVVHLRGMEIHSDLSSLVQQEVWSTEKFF